MISHILNFYNLNGGTKVQSLSDDSDICRVPHFLMYTDYMAVSVVFTDCYSRQEAAECEDNNGTWFNMTCNDGSLKVRHLQVSASEEYFK